MNESPPYLVVNSTNKWKVINKKNNKKNKINK